jgi:hypothetical protein
MQMAYFSQVPYSSQFMSPTWLPPRSHIHFIPCHQHVISYEQVSIQGPSGMRRKTIHSVADKGANQLFFKDEKAGKSVSVADYFKSTGR